MAAATPEENSSETGKRHLWRRPQEHIVYRPSERKLTGLEFLAKSS